MGTENTLPVSPRAYSFIEINQTPDHPGVYAWYYRSLISKRDIDDFLTELSTNSNESQRAEKIRTFLNLRLFAPLQEAPYTILVQGPLKPTYRGAAEHVPSISDNLIERIAQDPQRLRALDNALRKTVPHFASPIYIGVATQSLRKRLQTHRNLIEKYREGLNADEFWLRDGTATTEAKQDHSFAREVVHERKLHPSKLQVYVLETEISAAIAIDVENVLNRLNYPLCGRQ